jgi:hypothetical protein
MELHEKCKKLFFACQSVEVKRRKTESDMKVHSQLSTSSSSSHPVRPRLNFFLCFLQSHDERTAEEDGKEAAEKVN